MESHCGNALGGRESPACSKTVLYFLRHHEMYRGYTKRWRKRWSKDYHKDRLLWVLMDYFIDHANYVDKDVYIKGAGLVPVKRGQHLFGTLQLADFIGVDRQRIRTKLKILEKIQFLTIKPTNRFSIATIINYDIYNPLEEQTNQHIDQQLTSNKPATNQQLTTPNKDNKEKKVNNIYPAWLDLGLWKEFKKMRIRIKKPMTEHAELLRIADLKKLVDKGYSQDEIINKSIACSWQDFYEPKDEGEKNAKFTKTGKYDGLGKTLSQD